MRMIITPKEAAEEMHISVNEVLKMLSEGRIEAFKQGNHWKIPSERLKKTVEMWAEEETEKRKNENRESDGYYLHSNGNWVRGL